ncbi:hypothetical protein AQUCO_02200016v1 [Aquilegia coerulea]|uniref:DUF659 domain-containing protein n=1 Tax=Aquilegia coerulea TaxID=218851 RepID=A0A2G5DCR3_AQUCA|nr:hypothetical protein AQUCO_02200016v1 [Aquilegia coerulea]
MAWEHCTKVVENHNVVTCKYYGRTFFFGGGGGSEITRFKRHLAGGDPNVEICAVGKYVRNLFRQVVDQIIQRRNAKTVGEKNFQDALLHIDDSESKEYSDEDPEIRDFQRRRHSSFAGLNKERGSGSWSTSRRQTQSSINKFFRSESVRSVGSNPYTQPTIDATCRAGLGVRIPTPYELLGPQLNIIVGECDQFIDGIKKKWGQCGVTIMCDGWTGPTKYSLMNFMVYCDSDSCFIKSVDVLGFCIDAKLILEQMKKVVDKMGKEYVVQIVTNNGANYKKAGEDLCKLLGYNMFWTGCAAHSIDLILKEFCRKDSIKKVIGRAKKITKEFCGGDIVRPALTRFATNFLGLQRMLKKQESLKEMIIHPKWIVIRTRTKDKLMVEIEYLINNRQFLRKIKCVCDSLEPMVETLRKVDDDKVPTMDFLYKWMENLKQKVMMAQKNPKWLFRQQTGSFGNVLAKKSIFRQQPTKWWINYGYDAPSLRKVAVCILPQTVASSGYERNWSTFGMIQSNRRCRVNLKTLDKLKHARRVVVVENEPVNLTLLYPRVDASDSNDAPMDWIEFEDEGDLELNETPRVPNPLITNEMGVNVQDNIVPEDPVDTQLNVPRSGEDDPLGDHPNIRSDGSDLFRVHLSSGSLSDSDDSGTGGVISSSRGKGVAGSSRVYESFLKFHFTGESQFDYATQDEDHGPTTIPKRQRQRRPHPTADIESSRVEDSYPNPSHPYSQSDYPPRDGAWFPDANQWLPSMTNGSDIPSLDTAQPIRMDLRYPISESFFSFCAYEMHVLNYWMNYSQTMTWDRFCNEFFLAMMRAHHQMVQDRGYSF